MKKWAVISECGKYRYALSRSWDNTLPKVMFLMLNPSKADGKINDPTITRCINFAKSWGYGGIYVGNIYSFRATKPKELRKQRRLKGPRHNKYLDYMMNKVDKIVLGWGAYNGLGFSLECYIATKGYEYKCFHLGLTKWGNPRHPLFLRKDTELIPY